MNNFCLTVIFTSFIVMGAADAQQGADTQGKGEVDGSGKFVPKKESFEETGKVPTAKEAKKIFQAGMKLEDLGGGLYRLGNVRLDKNARTVTFPVKVNMKHGVVEYLLVTEQGKAHEAVFTTTAKPSNIHLACLLLGMEEVVPKNWPKNFTEIPARQAVNVEVTWLTNGPPKKIPLSNFIVKKDPSIHHGDEVSFKQGAWLYSGSHFFRGEFVADSEGSIISVIRDNSALLNAMREGGENDLMHHANEKVLTSTGGNLKMVLSIPVQPVMQKP